MAEAALGLWIVTAIGGVYLWSYATGVGRAEDGSPTSDLSPLVLFVHPLLELSGLAVWIAYVSADEPALAWVAFAILISVALLGDVLLAKTIRGRGGRQRAEDRMPKPAIAAHGLLAGLTIVLVFLEALRAS